MVQILPPAPDELLDTICCNFKNGCCALCGFRILGLQCSLALGQCNGKDCLNTSSYQSDLYEESAFDSEILDGLETNILDNEDDNELEI